MEQIKYLEVRDGELEEASFEGVLLVEHVEIVDQFQTDILQVYHEGDSTGVYAIVSESYEFGRPRSKNVLVLSGIPEEIALLKRLSSHMEKTWEDLSGTE